MQTRSKRNGTGAGTGSQTHVGHVFCKLAIASCPGQVCEGVRGEYGTGRGREGG